MGATTFTRAPGPGKETPPRRCGSGVRPLSFGEGHPLVRPRVESWHSCLPSRTRVSSVRSPTLERRRRSGVPYWSLRVGRTDAGDGPVLRIEGDLHSDGPVSRGTRTYIPSECRVHGRFGSRESEGLVQLQHDSESLVSEVWCLCPCDDPRRRCVRGQTPLEPEESGVCPLTRAVRQTTSFCVLLF